MSNPNVTYSGIDEIRLDRFLALEFPERSRTYFQRLIDGRKILVDDHPVSPHHKLKNGQVIHINWPVMPVESEPIHPSELPFPILHEDSALLVINKPARLLCHPTGTRKDGTTLVELLRAKIKRGDWPDEIRPGLVHRLDRDTTGVLLFAKTPEAHAHLTRQFSKRQIKKTYVALVKGHMADKEGTLECHLARDPFRRKQFRVAPVGRLAITKFKVLEHLGDVATYVELYPLTGRTHQLRVQLSGYHYPILGDELYSAKEAEFSFARRHMLHASKIQFTHPDSKKVMEFAAPLPDDFQEAIKLIRLKL
jgi:23S rRNA pseudouridine1911/1915/1917 synthase